MIILSTLSCLSDSALAHFRLLIPIHLTLLARLVIGLLILYFLAQISSELASQLLNHPCVTHLSFLFGFLQRILLQFTDMNLKALLFKTNT